MTKRRKNNNKWWYWLGMLVVVGLIAAGGFLIIRDRQDGKGGAETSENEQEEVEVLEEEVTDKQEEVEVEEPEEDTPQYEGQDPNTEETLSGVITYAGVSGSKLMIRVNIDQYLDSGSCALTLTKGGAIIYSDRANIAGAASTATCEGFDVPLDKLGEGTIQININLTADGKTGVIRREVEI